MTAARVLLAALVPLLSSVACGPPDGAGARLLTDIDLAGAQLTVGSKAYTEQLILGEIAVAALEAAGAEVDNRVGLEGSQNVRRLLLDGQLDLYWEYTGTAWTLYHGQTDRFDDPDEQYRRVAAADLEQHGIRWLTPAPFDNTYAIVTTPAIATATGITTLSDLAQAARTDTTSIELCVAREFLARSDGLPGLQQHYDFTLPPSRIHVRELHHIPSAIDRGQPCTFGEVFTTSAAVAGLGLQVLTDDRGFFPIYRPAITTRAETVEQHPDLARLFEHVASRLDRDTMLELNRQVEIDGRRPAEVASNWVSGLLTGATRSRP